MWRIISLIPLLCISSLFYGASVRIYNDSAYPLRADILSADGKHKGSLTLVPQQQALWQDNYGGNTTWSETPYTIILTCKNGKQFGTISNVEQGGTVSVMSARGPLYCEQDQNQQQGQQGSKENQSGKDQQNQQQPPFDPNQQPYNPNQVPFNPNQTPFNPSPGGGQSQQGTNQQGQQGSDPGSAFGPADPSGAPGDPIWGPP